MADTEKNPKTKIIIFLLAIGLILTGLILPNLYSGKKRAVETNFDSNAVETDVIYTIDPYDVNLSDFIPTSITIGCEGNYVVINFGGDEVKVTGASEEGARIFFVELLKPMIDDYIKAKMNERRNFQKPD